MKKVCPALARPTEPVLPTMILLVACQRCSIHLSCFNQLVITLDTIWSEINEWPPIPHFHPPSFLPTITAPFPFNPLPLLFQRPGPFNTTSMYTCTFYQQSTTWWWVMNLLQTIRHTDLWCNGMLCSYRPPQSRHIVGTNTCTLYHHCFVLLYLHVISIATHHVTHLVCSHF